MNLQAVAGKPWTDRLYVRKFSSFFQCLAQLLELVDDAYDAGNRYIDESTGQGRPILYCNQVKRLHDLLHTIALSNVRRLSAGIPGAPDEYEDCPLVVIYDGVAACVHFLRQFFPLDVEDDYYVRRPGDIPYCVQYGLAGVADAEIRAFTLQQLLCVLSHLEQSAHTIVYDDALTLFVDALDARVCDFLLYAMPDVAHNIENCRVAVGPDLFTCSTAMEFQLVVSILAVRQLLESAAPLWRGNELPVPPREEDAVLVAAVRAKFIAEIQSVHSDIVEENFYKRYTQDSIANSEGYLFLKANPSSTRIDPGSIIRQFRNVPQWRRITETAARPVVDFLFDADTDFLGFKIAFALAADLIFNQTLRCSWFEFFTDGTRIRNMNASDYQIFIEETYRAPIFVVLLNDACVMFRGRLTVFGRRHDDYYRALIHWMVIVQQELDGQYRRYRQIAPLVDVLFNTQIASAPSRAGPSAEVAGITRRDFAVKEGEESYCIDPSRILSELNAERRAYRAPPALGLLAGTTPLSVFAKRLRAKAEYEHITARIETKPQEIDANNIIGDTDETGFPTTARSAWT